MCKNDKAQYNENQLGEKMVLDKLIAMDDVSGLADKSDEFANFFTVLRKYGITCLYIFILFIQAGKIGRWLSQTQIYNFFPGSLQASSIVKVFLSFANRFKNTYIPYRNHWINKL